MALPFPVDPQGSPQFYEILIGGQRFATAMKKEGKEDEPRIITYADPGALSFYDGESEGGMPTYGWRFERPGVTVKTIEALFKHLTQVVIHTDLTSDAAGCFRALKSRDLSSHLLVNWDGTVYQPLDILHSGYHAGAANDKSIGVDMNNKMPNLEREPNEPPYPPNYDLIHKIDQNKKHKRPLSDRMTINGARVRSYGYTDPQYRSLIEIMKVVIANCENIKVQYPAEPDGTVVSRLMDDPAGFQGFIAHWHWESQRWDPGPGFDWQRLMHGLRAEHNSFPVLLSERTNISDLGEPALVKAQADLYYANNATKTTGWFPMGINQTWHNGIHLSVSRGTDVHAMFDGIVVAARFGKKPSRLGHNNFILLRHSIPIPTKKNALESKSFVFFSLYMHLDALDVSNLTPDSPDWLRQLHLSASGKEDEDGEAIAIEAKARRDEEESELDDEDPDAIAEDMWLEVGDHLAALKRGYVAKISYKERPIRVPAGQILGKVGLFNQDGELTPQLHVEVFADTGWKDAVDIGVHGRYLVELDDDVGSDLFVENRDVLSLFGTSRQGRRSLLPNKILSPATIADFWAMQGEYEEEKAYLRKVVVRHVSEWSDAVDWVQSLSSANSWDEKVSDFKKILRQSSLSKDAIATVLPFIWLSKDMAEHIGLNVSDWKGLLDFFHPIHFLMWLTYHSTQRLQIVSAGVSARVAKQKAKEREKLEEQCRMEFPSRASAQAVIDQNPLASQCMDVLTEETRSESTLMIAASEDLPDLDAFREWMDARRSQGEWRPPLGEGEEDE